LLEKLSETRRGLTYLKELLREADSDLQRSRNAEDVYPERKGIQLLLEILADIDTDVKRTQKRTCKVNLGGHCSTEDAVALADHWHFLNSADSPGRKRRQAKLMNNAMFRRK